MKVEEKDIREWCKALRSGNYEQTKGTLQDKNGYCCLGVACKIFTPKNKLLLIDGYLRGILPSLNNPYWLRKINQDFFNRTTKTLSALNDEENFSFNEIADLLEYVYIHKVL